MRIKLLCTAAMILASSTMSFAQTRLTALESEYHSLAKTDISPILDATSIPELQLGSGDLLIAEMKAKSLENSKRISSLDIAEAFNLWVDSIGGTAISHISPADVTAHRIFLSHFAPTLFSRGKNAAVAAGLSRSEALYLLDRLISQGGCPKRSKDEIAAGHYSFDPSSDKALPVYRATMHAFYASMPVEKRLLVVRAVLTRAHLL